MLGIFRAIKDFFVTIFEIINFIFSALVMLFKLLISAISFFGDLIGMLPPVFLYGAMALLIVCILYKILGRENQS